MYTLNYDIDKLLMSDNTLIKNSLLNIINNLTNDNVINVIKSIATITPIVKFASIYYILESVKPFSSFDEEYSLLKKYINYDFDIFMFANYLVKE